MTLSETPYHVDVESDVETFVIAPDYSLLRRELGPFSGTLPSGIYKFKFRRGTTLVEDLYELPPTVAEPVAIAPRHELELESAVPLQPSRQTDARQVTAARDASHKTQLTRGQGGSSIYIFVRNAPDAPPRSVAAGLSLYTLDGAPVADASDFEISGEESSQCAAFNVTVEPGAYRLRMSEAERTLEQIVVASPGWQTQIFLLHEAPTTVARPMALATASVLICRGGFDPGDEMLRLAEAARIALTMQRGTIPRHLVTRLLDEKFEHPMLGIYAAHAIAMRGGNDDGLLEHVLQALERLVPGHPDVVALRLESQSGMVIDTPPMLRTSWNAIVAANADGRLSLAPRSLASRIPASLAGGTPWLIWDVESLLQPEATEERNVESDLLSIDALIHATLDSDEEPVVSTLSGTEEALYSYLRSRASAVKQRVVTLEGLESTRPRMIDDRRLARAFGTTVQQVQTTVTTLAGKLKMTKE
ncbi:MAG TPA: hypothetical protein VND45_03150 [Thermoanaerobaculia bacterium]|jgi:hypothetical protein|nr:hypothetical protein [Thermoanaerobaculia bacterium]